MIEHLSAINDAAGRAMALVTNIHFSPPAPKLHRTKKDLTTVPIHVARSQRSTCSSSNMSRGAESRTWPRVQLKYDGFPFLWTPKQTEKMPQFCPNYDVISKKNKKLFTEILTVFPVEIRWSPKKKVFKPHMLISQCHFDGPLSSSRALCWAR